MTDSRRLPGLMFIHLLIVFRPHANVQMEALLVFSPPVTPRSLTLNPASSS